MYIFWLLFVFQLTYFVEELFMQTFKALKLLFRVACECNDPEEAEIGPRPGEGQGGPEEEETCQGSQENGQKRSPTKTSFRV